MKKKEFDKLAAQTKLSEQGKLMAKLHLVDGLSLEDAGRQVLGVTYEADGVTPVPTRWRVHKAVGVIRRAAEGANEQPKIVRTTAEEFERLADTTEMREDSREMARRYFVDGMSMEEAGRPYGVSRQRVNQLVQIIRRAFARQQEAPMATVTASLELPAGLVGALQEFGSAIEACDSDEHRERAVGDVTRAVKKATGSLS